MTRLTHNLLLGLCLLTGALAAPPPRFAAADVATVRIVIDRPAPGDALLGEVVVAGWAADPLAPGGTGVDAVHVYLDAPPWEGGALLGAAEYGLPRPDVAAELGDARFAPSGFRFTWEVAAPAGPHTLYVLAHAGSDRWAAAGREALVDPRAPRYAELEPPGDDDDPVNRRNALDVLLDLRDAMAPLHSMRERRTGHLYAPDGSEQNRYLYNLEYQAPDRFLQQSTVTTPEDSKEQRIITIGKISWFWRGGDHWEETQNRTPYEWPGEIYYYRGITSAQRLADDTIGGRTYRVVEFTQGGSEWIGAPGWIYRVRLWVDAETSLPHRLQKAALNIVIKDGKAVPFQYREQTEFFDFNAPIDIQPPPSSG